MRANATIIPTDTLLKHGAAAPGTVPRSTLAPADGNSFGKSTAAPQYSHLTAPIGISAPHF
jgi:hypothetical protein